MAGATTWRWRLRSVASWLGITPSELLGLTILLVSALGATGLLWWQSRPLPSGQTPGEGPAVVALTPSATGPSGSSATPSPGPVVVHVAGAVADPKVVELAPGARVTDALQAAGGVLEEADLTRINLASVLRDGQQLVVPRVGEPAPAAGADTAGSAVGPASAPGGEPGGPLDLNRATAAELEELPNIGPVLAARIVDWREANGGFDEVGQLREVSGIGERTLEGVADLVTVG